MNETIKRAALILFLLPSLLLSIVVETEVRGSGSTEEYYADESDPAAHEHNNDGVCDGDKTRMEGFLEFWESEASMMVYDGWKVTDIGTIEDWIGCDESEEIPTDADYSLMVEAYLYSMNNHDGSTTHKGGKYHRSHSVQAYNPQNFDVPVEVRLTPGKGRGVFATADITAGSLVATPTNSMEFYSKESYRDFLAYLVLKRFRMICNTFDWIYSVQKTTDPDDFIVCLDADSATLINSGRADFMDEDDEYESEYGDDDYGDDERKDTTNIAQVDFTGAWSPVYAMRDIKSGEELLMCYSDFAELYGFRYLGIWMP